MLGLHNIKNYTSDFVQPKAGEQPKYNAANNITRVTLSSPDYKITFWKSTTVPAYPATKENIDLDLMEDE